MMRFLAYGPSLLRLESTLVLNLVSPYPLGMQYTIGAAGAAHIRSTSLGQRA